MQDLQYHAALTAKLIDAIKSIPVPQEWTNGYRNWKYINGVLCSQPHDSLKWHESIYRSIEELRSNAAPDTITPVTK